MRRLLRRLARSLGPDTQRAIEETVADAMVEARASSKPIARVNAFARGLAAIVRIVGVAITSFTEGEHPMRFLGNDVRSALRRLRRAPLYVTFSVLTLALAIGSTTAVYSVIEAALFRQQPIPHLDRIVNIYQSDMRFGASGPMISLSMHDFDDLRASQTAFSEMAAWQRFNGTAIANGSSQSLLGEMVSGSYFPLLGVNAALGRVLQPADDTPQAPPAIVLSDGLWRRMFGADPSIVGQSIRLHGIPFQVIGVAPAWFRGSDMPNIVPTPAWISMAAGRRVSGAFGSAPGREDRDRRALMIKARLKPGVALEAARAEVTAISQRIASSDRARRSSRDPKPESGLPPVGWFVLPMADLRMHESVHAVAGPLASALMGAVVLVLLVGCSNLANLTLARAARRRREVAVRLALGASRLRIVREQLVESAIVAGSGWALGLVIARGLMSLFGSSVEMHAAVSLTLQLQPRLNLPVLAASVFATALAIVAVGLGPALRQSGGNIRDAMAAGGSGSTSPRWFMRGSLVTGQVAVSVLLLSFSMLCLSDLRASVQHDPGFDLEKLAVMQLDFSDNQYESSRVQQEIAALQQMTSGLQGAESSAVMSAMPIGTARYASVSVTTPEDVRVAPAGRSARGRWMAVSGPVFETLGVKIVDGRAFDERDRDGSPAVAVISQTLAESAFPDGHAVGRQLSVKHANATGPGTDTFVTVIGVAATTDTDIFGAGRREPPAGAFCGWSSSTACGRSPPASFLALARPC